MERSSDKPNALNQGEYEDSPKQLRRAKSIICCIDIIIIINYYRYSVDESVFLIFKNKHFIVYASHVIQVVTRHVHKLKYNLSLRDLRIWDKTKHHLLISQRSRIHNTHTYNICAYIYMVIYIDLILIGYRRYWRFTIRVKIIYKTI